jgi:hypothetical protein
MRTTLLSLLLLLVTGCADDLVGPDVAPDVLPSSAHGARSHTAPADPDAQFPSIAGTWLASDASGSIELFIGEDRFSPDVITDAVRSIEGKGIVTDLKGNPLFVAVEGTYRLRDIAFTLSESGGTIAKAEGKISRDFALIKVILYDGSDRERTVVFERS